MRSDDMTSSAIGYTRPLILLAMALCCAQPSLAATQDSQKPGAPEGTNHPTFGSALETQMQVPKATSQRPVDQSLGPTLALLALGTAFLGHFAFRWVRDLKRIKRRRS